MESSLFTQECFVGEWKFYDLMPQLVSGNISNSSASLLENPRYFIWFVGSQKMAI